MFCTTHLSFAPLIDFFALKNYERIEPPVLQPAHIFTELSGEDLRRRLFITQDREGSELCLRPEYTIPVAREHLKKSILNSAKKSYAAYCYLGAVFRFRSDGSSEFLQAGTESIGRTDKPVADAEIIVHALEGLSRLQCVPSVTVMGDMALLNAVLHALKLSEAAKRRILSCLASGRALDSLEAPEIPSEEEHAGILAAIEGQDPHSVQAFVEDILSIAGITRVGGRSAGEIAQRFLAKASNRSSLSPEQKDVLQRYLAISKEPDEAVEAIRLFAQETKLDISQALSELETRIGFIAALYPDLSRFRFDANFVRDLDYYTGFIFEIYHSLHLKPVAAGGRYDRLLQHLGAEEPIPAVGCALWLDRLS